MAAQKAEKAAPKGKVYAPSGMYYLGLTALSRRHLRRGSRFLAEVQGEIRAEIALWSACAEASG